MIAHRLSARRLTQLLGNWRGEGYGYLELASSIDLLVRDGALASGTALPAERPLAKELGVSRTTVSACYQRLRETGVALTRQGSGTVIRAPRPSETAPGPGGQPFELDLSAACPEPWSGLAELGARGFAEHPDTFLTTGYDTLGRADLREAIAARYSQRGLPTSPDQIMVTLGAQHAIFLIARTLLSRGDRSLIESPSYPHAREALAATGALVAELPVGLSGHDAAATIETVRRTSPRLSYLIPDHHNPTGLSMPPELRTRLLAELSAQGGYVIVDETTAELTLRERRLVLPFAASAEHAHEEDRVLTVGSLGKTVWGGLRIGWVRAAPEMITRLEVSRRIGDLGTGSWEQVLATLALESYEEILEDRSRSLTARHRVLSEQIAALLPGWQLSRADGGVCVWADLGAQRSSTLSRECARLGLKLTPGPRFGSPGVFERFVRLPFSASEDDLVASARVLERAWAAAPQPGVLAVHEEAVI